MTYSPDRLPRDLGKIRDGTATFDDRAELEGFLLAYLGEHGPQAVEDLLTGLPDFGFAAGGSDFGGERIVRSSGPARPRLVVTIYRGAHSASVDVSVESEAGAPAEPDPRHEAFYRIWEEFTADPSPDVNELPDDRRAVFLIGLLEAELMNGGFGQYLANHETAYLAGTLECLARIGADTTRALLERAVALGSGHESWGAAWDAHADELGRLDDDFLEAGEDLAGLTADAYLEPTDQGDVVP